MSRYDCEEINYLRDPRTRGRAKAPVLHTDDGTEVPLPMHWEVCPVCNGTGTHVNPSIDCGGLSREDFDADPDFAEDYMSGVYDVQCNRCGGRTTVQEVDWDRLTDEQRAQYEAQLDGDAEDRAIELAERRMGA